MPDTHVTKNYFAHGGNELVIGGKLTFLPGAVIEGGDLGDFGETGGGGSAQIPYIADSTATTVAALKENFNALLAALRTAGLMAAETIVEPEPENGGNDNSDPAPDNGDGNDEPGSESGT